MKRILSVVLEKEPGALVRVIGIINRRRFKLESFTVGGCESKHYDRLNIVIKNDNYQEQVEGDSILQLTRQLRRLINVLEVTDITLLSKVQRELLLVKIQVEQDERLEIINLMKVFRFKIVDISSSMVILEINGDPGKIKALEELLTPYNIIELVRTGEIGLVRDSAISTETVTQFPEFYKKSLGKKYASNFPSGDKLI